MLGGKTKLSSSMTVAQYLILEAENDRQALSDFIVERFDERFFLPIDDSDKKHGFAVLAIACLVIETIESFYQGLPDTKTIGTKIFRDFFARDTCLRVFASENDWFYKDIRCGILHQSETRGGWRVLRKGPLLDAKNKAINATLVLRALRRVVQEYSIQIQTEEILWENFRKKMDAVCANCE